MDSPSSCVNSETIAANREVIKVPDSDGSLRIDRWLYYCRFFKTRARATKAVSGGHVKLNGERVVPGSRVRPGDRIALVRDRLPYALDVVLIPMRRGPAQEARACYVEEEHVVREREELKAALRVDRMSMQKSDGRPDKHTRRLLRSRNRSN